MPLTEAERARVAEINDNYHAYDNGNLMRSVRRLLTIIDRLSEQPEVVRAYWKHCGERFPGGVDWYECSACGGYESGVYVHRNFCAQCGAQMNGQRAGEEEHG